MLTKWRHYLATQVSLQTKIVGQFLVLLLIVLGCFLAYVNWIVIQPLKETSVNDKQLTAASISNQLEEYIQSQNQMSHRILSNKQVFDVLSAGMLSTATEERLRQSRILKDAMFQAIGPTMNIREMILYDIEGRLITSFIGYLDNPSVLDPTLKIRFETGDLGERSFLLSRLPSGIMAFHRAIINQNGDIFGYLTIQMDQSYLQQPAEDFASSFVYIMDEQHELVSGSRHQLEEVPELLDMNQATGMYRDDSQNYVTYDTSDITEWTTYVVTPEEAVLGPVNSVMNVSILIIAGLMLVLFMYIFVAAKNVLLPIRKLRAQIARIEYSNLNVKVDNRSQNNELLALSDTFQDLLGRLQGSIEREKTALLEEVKARNSALQAQIAPHFIHNVLYLISIAAQEGKNQAVSDMCKHLSESLRYIVSSPNHHVTLAEELEHTKHYLSLVKQNYEDDLEWEITADETTAWVQLPRLVIQPFVENCIEHAFTHTDPPWRIRIHYKLYNGLWALEISDNGSGIDPEKIAEIMANVQASPAAGDNPDRKKHWGNMGIANTVHRLQLMYQNRLFFNLYNNPSEEKGVTVQIIASLTEDFY